MPVPPCRHRPLSATFVFVSVLALVAALRAQAPATPPSRPGAELLLHKWSGAVNVPDPVACAVDPQGRVYVSATTRRKVGDLDIREHTMWIADDVSFQHIDDKEAFLKRELAPGKTRAPRGGLADHNKDGSIDWQDLTVHSEVIYQLRDTDGDGTADKITVFAAGFNTPVTGIAAGVLYHDGWVYATIAPDLWRFKDTNDDGVADIREIVVHGFGLHIAYAGHDMHGLSVGPDGRIYWSIGDKGVNVTSKEGRKFYCPNSGAVMRVDPDGSNFEVYAFGLRNPQEPAFDEFGDLFCVDNDADQPGERERFVYIPEASETGWRCNFQYMRTDSPWMREGLWKPAFAGQAAYLMPALLSYSDGPAGFRYEPGTALSDAQRGMFILNEFPSGKMKAFRAARDGASYKMTDARVLNDGIMGIGLSWHPDGSLFLADWIGGYPLDGLGAIWRVDAKGGDANPHRRETHAILKAGFEKRADTELVAQLAHRDQRVRQGAQLELAKRGKKDAFLAVARDAQASQLARVHAVWGCSQLVRRKAADTTPLVALLRDTDPEIRRQSARALGDAATVGAAAKADGRALIALLNDAEPRVRTLAAIALGKFREPTAVDALLAMAARDGAEPVARQAVIAGLAGCATAAQLVAKGTDASVIRNLCAVVALRRQAAPEVASFLNDSDILVVQEAARAIHDDLGIPAALPALAALLDRAPASEIVTRRAINAALRLGTADAAGRVLKFALEAGAPLPMREEALRTLKMWKEPPRLDPVDGYARTFKTAALDGLLMPKLDALLGLAEPSLKTLAVEIMLAHMLKAAPAQLIPIVNDAKAAAAVRAGALRLLAAGDVAQRASWVPALDTALAAGSPAVLHRAAMEIALAHFPGRLVREATATLAARGTTEKQHALALLGRAAFPAADTALDSIAAGFLAGKLAPELSLDLLDALRARAGTSSTLAAKLKACEAAPMLANQAELLTGGDITRGRDLVANHLAANCTACHSVESAGSEVGPNLRTIGAVRDARYLLESLLTPSAQIATGFGLVNVTLKDKTEVTGTLASENADSVTVRLFDGQRKTLRRADIAQQTPPVSIMPPMAGILQPRELRDVVAYLASLKGGNRRNRPAATDEH
ncbi:MAG: HEAT repeat domain-containing protein [Verrucomicrobia bacterium]|nr:HEAT repeat domain-containing protein [Verrucomicrobiota bacterium]